MDIEQLIHTYGHDLYRIAYIYTKDLQVAEEVVQDVFIKYYHAKQFEGRSNVKTYLIRMTINRSYDYLRTWKSRSNQVVEFFLGNEKSSEQQTIIHEERQAITAAVLKLPTKYREILLLYYYEDLQVKEIAELLNMSQPTVKTRLQRARKQLKLSLPKHEWEVLRDV